MDEVRRGSRRGPRRRIFSVVKMPVAGRSMSAATRGGGLERLTK